jgi:hypothetical protein
MPAHRLVAIGLALLLIGPVLSAGAADIGGLLDRARAANGRADPAAAIEALEQALEAVRTEAPLVLAVFTLVDRPAKLYGDYVPSGDTVLKLGEPLHFYTEPKNLVYVRKSEGTLEASFKADVRIMGADGTSLFEQADVGSWPFASRSRVQDVFMNITLTLTGAPPGDYTVEFTVRDGNSSKTARATQRITLK